MAHCSWWERPLWPCVLVGLLGVALYLPTLSFGFVNLDDPWLIRDNRILQRVSASHLARVWGDLSTETRLQLGSEYLPVRDISVMLDWSLFGSWVGGFHLTNVLLFGLLCGLLTAVLFVWWGSLRLAWMAGAVFACHPVHVEAVAWLSERKGLLAGVFLALSLLAVARFARHGTWIALSLACLALILAIWSKALAITGVAWAAVSVWLLCKSENVDVSWRRLLGGGAVLTLVAVAAFVPVWLAGQRVDMVQEMHGGSRWATLWMMGEVHFRYVLQMLMVHGYGVKYPVDAGAVSPVMATLGLGLALLLVGVAVGGLFLSRWRLAAWAAWTWLIFLSPVSQVLVPLQNVMADRYVLLPSLAFAVLVAGGLLWACRFRVAVLLWAAVLTVAAGLTLSQTQTWRNTETLLRQALRTHPTWVEGMMQLARIEANRGHLQRAHGWVAKARKIQPLHPKVALRFSLLLLRRGKVKQAVRVLQAAARRSSDDKIRANLALLLHRQGRNQEALRWAKEAVRIRRNVAHNQRTLGVIALANHQFRVAERAFRRALRLEPYRRQNMMNLAAVLLRTGQHKEARQWIQRAQRLRKRR